jgi:hypothetical protein
MRKYIYKLPEIDMDERVVIGHRIFLTSAQRKLLQMPKASVDVLGTYHSVNVVKNDSTNEPVEEVYGRYRLVSEKSDKKIEKTDDGYLIRIDKPSCLDDIKNGGSEWCNITYSEIVDIDGKPKAVIHQTVISGKETLDRSIVSVHFDQTSSR